MCLIIHSVCCVWVSVLRAWVCRIMEAALGGDGGAMDHVVDEVFFQGSISEAILRAQGNDLVLIVFVAG
jgi:hypothetical protein